MVLECESVKSQRWELWDGKYDEPELIGTFDTKNDAIRYAKWQAGLDEKSISFHYNAKFNVWSDDYSGDSFTISDHGFPQAESVKND